MRTKARWSLSLACGVLIAGPLLSPVAAKELPVSDNGVSTVQANEQAARTERIQRFLELLGTLRGGDLSAREPLLAVAGELCEFHGRCDTVVVARFYAGLEQDELRRGLAYEVRYRELFSAVNEARRQGLTQDDWMKVRREILGQLATLAAESGSDADHAPAGRALSLSAILRAKSLEKRAKQSALSYQHELRAGHDEVSRALEIFNDAGLRSPVLEALWVQGRLFRLSNRRERAGTSFEQCLEQANELVNDTYAERALIELLRIARELGDTRRRGELLEELSELRRPEESWPLVREYADWMFQGERAAEAQALLIRYPPAAKAELSDWHIYLGGTSLRAGDIETAEQQILWLEEHGENESAILVRAQWLLAEGRPNDVVLELGGGTLEVDFSARGEAIGRSLLGEAYARIGDYRSASEHLGRALGLAEVFRDHLGTSDHNVFGEWIGLHSVVLAAEAEARRGNALEAARLIENFQSRSLREARASHESKLAGPLSNDSLLGWADAYSLGLVSWAIGPDFGIVSHIAPSRSSGEPAWAERIDHGRKDLRSAARRLREAIRDNRAEEVASLTAEIAEVLFPPALRERIKKLSKRASNPRLLVLVHGPTELLPIELLLADSDALGFDAIPVVMPGLSDNQRARTTTDFSELGDWTLVAGAAVQSLPNLPNARAEIDELEQLLPRATALDASKESAEVEEALKKGRPLHIAAHLTWGCSCTETRLAPLSLQLGPDSSLCAHRIAELEPASPLVVLSACETAAGRFVDAEGLQGLTRAFLESGTRNLLVTNWPVDDRAAKLFALDFHSALLRGELPSVAAHSARRAARERGAPVADWAAFRLTGMD